MTRNIQELAVSFFLIMCGLGILFGILWVKPVIQSQRLLIEETRANQRDMMRAAKETRVLFTELGYATVVYLMMENQMIRPSDANKMIEQSLNTISAHSDRLGKLLQLLNEYRLDQGQSRR
ncbi:MAG: hypothetical protein QXZ09_09810 [Candidatus Methanomethylicaceae archaeon]